VVVNFIFGFFVFMQQAISQEIILHILTDANQNMQALFPEFIEQFFYNLCQPFENPVS
jgi:hypothetical protein